MFYRSFFILAFAALISSAAFAQSELALTPIEVAPYGTSATGETLATATYEARFTGTAANQSLYYSRAIAFSEAQTAAAARTRIFGVVAGAAAISAAVIGIGYFIDYVTHDIYPSQGNPGLQAIDGISWTPNGNSSCTRSTPAAAMTCQMAAYNPAVIVGYVAQGHVDTGSAYYFTYGLRFNNGIVGDNNVQMVGYPYSDARLAWLNDTVGSEIPSGPAAVSDSQLAAAVNSSPAAQYEAFHNPDGSPRVVAPMPSQMAEVAVQARHDMNQPLAEGETDPAHTEDEEPVVNGQQWPGFCAWASVVCNFLKTEDDDSPDPPLPEKPITPVTWVSGLGGGSCPSPRSIELSMGSYDFSWQPVCNVAVGIRALLLVSASLIAAYILSGAGKNA